MSAETAEHLFEPFYTTREAGKGTGLGLSIVHSIVTDLGGSIHVDSEPGKGARFTLQFPRASLEAITPRQTRTEEPAEPATVLLAEDLEAVRGLLRGWLAEAGYKVLEAGNGKDALRLSREHNGPIDLLIGNAIMPRTGGFELSRALSKERIGIETMLISGFAEELLEGLETLPPGARFIPKPFGRMDFLKNVTDLLAHARKKKSMSSSV